MADAIFGSFAQLTRDKIVVPVLSTGRFDITKDLFSALIDAALGEAFDEEWYGATYPDIRKGVQDKIVASGRRHYVQFGYFEHRLPRPIKVDPEYYCAENPDIGRAIREGGIESAQWHFDKFGFSEGRLPRAGWSLFPV